MKVWLIGENNPYGTDPRYDLFPAPEKSAGYRLCRKVLGMKKGAYLRSFERRNLLAQSRWSAPMARSAAQSLRVTMGAGDAVILLGKKVFDAWCSQPDNWWEWRPFEETDMEGYLQRILMFPHPSGLCRLWNEPGSFERAREAVVKLAPHLQDLIGTQE